MTNFNIIVEMIILDPSINITSNRNMEQKLSQEAMKVINSVTIITNIVKVVEIIGFIHKTHMNKAEAQSILLVFLKNGTKSIFVSNNLEDIYYTDRINNSDIIHNHEIIKSEYQKWESLEYSWDMLRFLYPKYADY